MTIKRVILGVLTVVALIPVLFNLIGSVNQPQVQANLQLYQTNLILQASELSLDAFPNSSSTAGAEVGGWRAAILGNEPYKLAQNQYEEAKKLAEKNLSKLEDKLNILSENQPEITVENKINLSKLLSNNTEKTN